MSACQIRGVIEYLENTTSRKMGKFRLLFHQKFLDLKTNVACFLLQTQQESVSHFQTRDRKRVGRLVIWKDEQKYVSDLRFMYLRDCDIHFRTCAVKSSWNMLTRSTLPTQTHLLVQRGRRCRHFVARHYVFGRPLPPPQAAGVSILFSRVQPKLTECVHLRPPPLPDCQYVAQKGMTCAHLPSQRTRAPAPVAQNIERCHIVEKCSNEPQCW